MNRKIVWGIEIINNTAKNSIRQLVDYNCINLTDISRKINNLILDNIKNLIATVDYPKKWNLVLNIRIIKIEEVYEEKGQNINITFGNSVPTLINENLHILRDLLVELL